MPYYCTVPRCTSMAGKAKNVSFHQFPRDEELAKLWNNILKRGKPYTKYSKVCSLHFTPDDYTITSGQKNKGQWRTLRKDAIPSQNLPSDSPMAYQRNSWTPPTMDTKMHQQMAQAIYVQTMLAMQAAGITGNSLNEQPSPPIDDTETSTTLHNLTQFEQIFSESEHTDAHTHTETFRCTQCSKCFKDPDVFLLHKRTHTNDTEEMLRANPILAGLLKTQANTSIDIKNVKSIENQIMTALAANMENYLRNLSTIMTQGTEDSNFENGTLSNFENGTLDSNLNGGNENSNSSFDGILDSQTCDSKDLESSDSNLVIDEDAC